jgi:hypothetical protein
MEHITVTIPTLFVLEKKRTATHTTTNRVQNLSPPQNLRRHHHSSERWRTKTITSTPGTLKPPERRMDRANRQPPHSGSVGWTRSEPKSDESSKTKTCTTVTDPYRGDVEGQRHSSHHRHRMFTLLTELLDWGKRKAVDWFECREKAELIC